MIPLAPSRTAMRLTRCAEATALAVILAGRLAAADLAPAQIFKLTDKGQRSEAGAFATTFVVKETVDEIEFAVDDPKSPNHLTLKHGSYQVEYADPDNVDFLRGRKADETGDTAKAFETYAKAAQSSRVAWVREISLYRAAQSAFALKKADEALALVTTLEKEAPRSLWLDDALLIRGQALAAKGDSVGAAKTYQTLTGMAAEWGEAAAILGARGQAGIAVANKQYAEAATLLSGLVARIGKNAAPEDLAPLMLELADSQHAAGKDDDALVSLRGIAYRDAGPVLQARTHYAWATILAARTDLPSRLQAYDHAAIAGSLKGADPATLATNRQLLISLIDKLTKDPAVSPADKAEYKRSISSF